MNPTASGGSGSPLRSPSITTVVNRQTGDARAAAKPSFSDRVVSPRSNPARVSARGGGGGGKGGELGIEDV